MFGLHPLSRKVVEARSQLEAINCKWCAACSRVRHKSDFHACKGKKDGLQVKCASCGRKASSRYASENRALVTQRHREWVGKNRDRHAAWMRAYRQLPEQREAHRLRAAATRSTVKGALKNRIAARMYAVLRGAKGGRRTEELIGYTMLDLRAHLERQFLKGMSWDNMGDWHIDHIIPLSSFAITGPDDPELKRAWALPNLRPLWAADNIRKHAKRETLL